MSTRVTSGGVSYISYKLFKGGENRSGFTLRVSSEHRLSLSAGFRSPWHQIKKTPQCISSQATPIGGKDSVKENRQGCLSRFIRAQIGPLCRLCAPHRTKKKKTPHRILCDSFIRKNSIIFFWRIFRFARKGLCEGGTIAGFPFAFH